MSGMSNYYCNSKSDHFWDKWNNCDLMLNDVVFKLVKRPRVLFLLLECINKTVYLTNTENVSFSKLTDTLSFIERFLQLRDLHEPLPFQIIRQSMETDKEATHGSIVGLLGCHDSEILPVCLLLEGMHMVSSIRKEKFLHSWIIFNHRSYYFVNDENGKFSSK